MRLPKPSSRSVPTIACSGTPAWRVRVPISPTSLPCSVCSSSLPSPVTTARDARMRSSKSSASSTNGAPGSSVAPYAAHSPPLSPPAPPVMGTPRGSLGQPLRQFVQPRARAARPSPRPRPSAARTPSARPRTACARRTARRSSRRRSRRPPRSPRSRPAPPSVVAEPPTATRITAGARLRGGRDQLAGPVGRGGPGVALVLGDQPEPAGHRHLDDRRAAVLDAARSRPAPRARAGRCTVAASSSPPSCGQQRVERPLATVRDRAQVRRHQPRRARSRGRSRPPPGRR